MREREGERDERLLVSLSLAAGRNPRQVARTFYAAGGEEKQPDTTSI
jgi:hypothetical protein